MVTMAATDNMFSNAVSGELYQGSFKYVHIFVFDYGQKVYLNLLLNLRSDTLHICEYI